MQQLIAAALMLLSTAAVAQDRVQGADPDLVQKALSALQAQRNRAMDEAASAEAQFAIAQQKIGELERQLDQLKKPAEQNK